MVGAGGECKDLESITPTIGQKRMVAIAWEKSNGSITLQMSSLDGLQRVSAQKG